MKKAFLLICAIAGVFLLLWFFPLKWDRLTDWTIRELGKRFGGELQVGEVRFYLFPLRLSFSSLSYRGQGIWLSCEKGEASLKFTLFKRSFLSFEKAQLYGLKVKADVKPLEGKALRPPLPGKELVIHEGFLDLSFGEGSFKAKLPYAYLNKKQKKAYLEVEPIEYKGSLQLLFEKHEKWQLSGKVQGFEVKDLRALLTLLGKGQVMPWIESGKLKGLEFKGVIGSWHPFALSAVSAKGEVSEAVLEPWEGLRFKEAFIRFELEGERVKVKGRECLLGNSILRKAGLQFDLNKGEFSFSSEVETSAEDLFHFLPLLVKGKVVKEVLDGFSGSKGSVKGYFLIKGKPKVLEVTATVDEFSLEVQHRHLPFPLRALGSGRVSKEGMVLLFKTLEGKGVRLAPVELHVPFGRGRGSLVAKGGFFDLEILAPILKLGSTLSGTFELKKGALAFEVSPLKVEAIRVQGIPNVRLFYKGRTFNIYHGFIEASQELLVLRGVSVQGSGVQGTATGEVHLEGGGFTSARLSLDLSFAEEFSEWLLGLLPHAEAFKLKEKGKFEGDVSVKTGGSWGINGVFQLEGDLRLFVDVKGERDLLEVKRLRVLSRQTNADISLHRDSEGQFLKFSGSLAGEDLKRFLQFGLRSLKGDFVYKDRGGRKAFFGWCELSGDLSKALEGLPLNMHTLRMEGKGDTALKVSGSGTFLNTQVEGGGSFDLVQRSFDLKLKGDGLDWEQFRSLFEKRNAFGGKGLKGRIEAEVGEVRLQGLELRDVKGVIGLDLPSKWWIDLKGGELCGLVLGGSINSVEGAERMELSVWASELELGPVTACLGLKEGLADGVFLMEAKVSSGEGGLWGEGSEGSLYLYSRKGRIYKLTALSKLFALLNATEILRGKVPELVGKGFPYDKFELVGKVRDGVLFVEEGVIEGQALKIFMEGKVYLRSGQVDLTVLVAPFRTLDVLLSNIPLLGYVLTGKSKTFLSLPFKVEGDYRQPDVFALPPQAIGKGLLGIVERTLRVPIKLVEPFTPK